MPGFLSGVQQGIGGGSGDKIKKIIKKLASKSSTASDSGGMSSEDAAQEAAGSSDAPAMHKGGKVHRTGKYTLKRGETVVPAGSGGGNRAGGRWKVQRKVMRNK